MLRAISRFTPALNAHVYASRRSPSTIGPVVVLLTAGPPSTRFLVETRKARQAGLSTASPGVDPAMGWRQAVAFGSPGLVGSTPVVAGDATCVVSYASVGLITERCSSVARMASCWY